MRRQRETAGFPGPKYIQVVRRDITRKWVGDGGNWCCGVGEEMDQDGGRGGAERPRYKKGRSELYIAPGYRCPHSRTRSIRRTL